MQGRGGLWVERVWANHMCGQTSFGAASGVCVCVCVWKLPRNKSPYICIVPGILGGVWGGETGWLAAAHQGPALTPPLPIEGLPCGGCTGREWHADGPCMVPVSGGLRCSREVWSSGNSCLGSN